MGEGYHQCSCFPTRKDDYHWEKRNLGIVEYRPDHNNDPIDFNQGKDRVQNGVVYHNLDNPDPSRRFKMLVQTWKYSFHFAVAFRTDGLS